MQKELKQETEKVGLEMNNTKTKNKTNESTDHNNKYPETTNRKVVDIKKQNQDIKIEQDGQPLEN